jgi:polyisoprenoid-binding protein YceI
MRRSLLLVALAFASLPAAAAEYLQAPGSTLAFAGTYQGEVFTGRFPGFEARLRFDPSRLANARLEVDIPLAGAATGNPDYDDNLRGASFLDVGRFPQARYTATRFRALGGDRYAADGTLSLHGISKPVTLTFTWTPGAQPVLAGRATVKRLDFGVGAGDWGDTDMIPDAIAVSTRVVFEPAK